MKVGILGISGRVGRILASVAPEAGDVLVGGTSRAAGPWTRFDDVAELARAVEIVLDFTHPSAVAHHAAALTAAETPWVLGTTGLDEAAQRAVADAALRIGIVQAANFSAGVTLMMALAERLAASLPAHDYDAEILEMHHRGKRDAPSGTAFALGHAIAAGRGRHLAEIAERARDGETGPRSEGAVGFAVLRGGAVVGEHAVSFTGIAERITLTHEAFDRRVFADGALRAGRWLIGKPPGLYTMRDVLGL